MATFSYEKTELRYNPYTKQIEAVGVSQADIDGIQAQIDINIDNIALKVSSSEIISQINLSTEGILIGGDNILLDGNVTVDGSFSITSISDASVLATTDYIKTGDLIATTNPISGVVIDVNGIRGYNSSDKNFEIDVAGGAFFKGTIVNVDSVSGKTVTLDTGELLFEDSLSTRKILYDEGGIRSYVGVKQTMNIWNDYTVSGEKAHIEMGYGGTIVGEISAKDEGLFLNGVERINGATTLSGTEPIIELFNYSTVAGSIAETSALRANGSNYSNVAYFSSDAVGGSSSTGATLFIKNTSTSGGQAVKILHEGVGRALHVESTNTSATGLVRLYNNSVAPTIALYNSGSGFDLSSNGNYGMNTVRMYFNSTDTGNYYLSRVGENIFWTNSGGSTQLN